MAPLSLDKSVRHSPSSGYGRAGERENVGYQPQAFQELERSETGVGPSDDPRAAIRRKSPQIEKTIATIAQVCEVAADFVQCN